jgi:hypothetical protein
VLPIFAIIAIGYAAARWRLLSEGAAKGVAEFAFSIAVPAFMLRTIATAKLPDIAPLSLWLSYFGAVLITWALAAIATRLILGRPAADGAAIALAATFGNVVMLGIPLALATLGPDAAGPIAIIISLHTPVLWLAATLHLEMAERSDATSLGGLARVVAGDLARNPIILAIAVGSLWRISGTGVPAALDRVLVILGQAAVPAALVSLGASLVAFTIAGQRATLLTICTLKLAVMPVAAYVLATKVLALPGLAASVLVLLAAMPTGANAYLFAVRHGRAVASASGAVALGTVLAAVTASAVVYALRP